MVKKIKEKRTPCPFCKELIIDGAKKCRFCGEMLESSGKRVKKEGFFKKKICIKAFYWIWLITCAIFLLSIKLFDTADSQFISSQIYSYFQTIFVLAIFIGGGTFIGLVVAILTSLNKKESRWYGLLTMGTLIVFFLIFFNHITQVESVADRNPLGPVEVIQAINKERENRGLETLVTEIQLDSAAKAYAQDMCDKNYYLNSDEDNEKYLEFVDNTGYEYNIVAFIMSEGVYDTNDLTEQWLGNPQIKEIVLSDRYSATGVGIVRCGLEVLGRTTDIIVQFYAEPTLTQTTKTVDRVTNNNQDLNNTQENIWGVEKIDEATTDTRFPEDERMGTAEELFVAINNYRQAHNIQAVQRHDTLCRIAQTRANQLFELGKLDYHQGFDSLANSQQDFDNMGEVISGGVQKQLAVHTVEWGWGRSLTGHKESILDSEWTYGCGGISGLFNVFIFGSN